MKLLLLQLLAIVLATRFCGAAAKRVGQPEVIGEIAAGVLLGPSLFGLLAPGASSFVFPPSSLPVLQLLSQIGVVLFMFVVGLELDPAYLRSKARAAIVVSLLSIAFPFVIGVAAALALYTNYAPPNVPFYSFGLFLGIAMSITAFPVLARILKERNLTQTSLGVTALTCAAIGDVTAWSILAFVVAVTTAGSAATLLLTMVTTSAVFVLVMLFVVRPLLVRAVGHGTEAEHFGKPHLAIVMAVLLSSALATEMIGIHALFGAFVAGAVMPTQGTLRKVLDERLESVTSVFLLPLFFVVTGLRTQVGLLNDVTSWAICLGIVLVATVGKLGGTALAARWTGSPWRESFALGALMNTRGLMELVALNVGYDLGILTPEIFTILVIMALVTTAITGPLLTRIMYDKRRR